MIKVLNFNCTNSNQLLISMFVLLIQPVIMNAQTPPIAVDDFYIFSIYGGIFTPLDNDIFSGQAEIVDVVPTSYYSDVFFDLETIEYFPLGLPPGLSDTLIYTIRDDTGLEASAFIVIDFSYYGIVANDDFFELEWGECNEFNIILNDFNLYYLFEINIDSVSPNITIDDLGMGNIQVCTDVLEDDIGNFTYTINNSPSAIVTIQFVQPVYPDAVSDTAQCLFNAFVIIDVLQNDNFNVEPDIVDFSQGSNGTVTLSLDNRLVYSPNDGFFGLDTFQYALLNDITSEFDIANVYVTVSNPVGIANPLSDDVVWMYDAATGLQIKHPFTGEFELYAMDGRLIYRRQLPYSESHSISLPAIDAGYYFFRIGNLTDKVFLSN